MQQIVDFTNDLLSKQNFSLMKDEMLRRRFAHLHLKLDLFIAFRVAGKAKGWESLLGISRRLSLQLIYLARLSNLSTSGFWTLTRLDISNSFCLPHGRPNYTSFLLLLGTFYFLFLTSSHSTFDSTFELYETSRHFRNFKNPILFKN